MAPHTPKLVLPENEIRKALPKIDKVLPFGSKIMAEILRTDEVMGTSLHIGNKPEMDGAPQAYIVALGPEVKPESGLKVGQRIYWTGRGTEVKDPNGDKGRVRALLEISNILAIIEEKQD